MRSLVVVCIFLASALGQEYLYGTAELQAAREAFFKEYKRLARLAELAPDIHIFFDDLPKDSELPAVSETYSFSTSLGKNHRFRPAPKAPAPQEPQPPTLEAGPGPEDIVTETQEEPVTAAAEV